jgi:hypothetical protein
LPNFGGIFFWQNWTSHYLRCPCMMTRGARQWVSFEKLCCIQFLTCSFWCWVRVCMFLVCLVMVSHINLFTPHQVQKMLF